MDDKRRTSAARERTLQRMRIVLGSATAVGVACSDGHTTRRKHHDDDDDEPRRIRSGDPSATVSAPKPQPSYMVVDMLPEPSRCSKTSAATLKATAIFVKDRDLTITITPAPEGITQAELDTLRAEGTLGKVEAKVTPAGLEIHASARPGGKALSFIVPVHCAGERGDVEISVDWSVQGTAPNVLLTTGVAASPRFH